MPVGRLIVGYGVCLLFMPGIARAADGGYDCPVRLARRAWGTVTDHRDPPARLDVVPERACDAATAPTIRPSPITGAMASSTSVISSSVAPAASAWLLLHSRQISIVGTRRRPRHHPDMGMYMG